MIITGWVSVKVEGVFNRFDNVLAVWQSSATCYYNYKCNNNYSKLCIQNQKTREQGTLAGQYKEARPIIQLYLFSKMPSYFHSSKLHLSRPNFREDFS